MKPSQFILSTFAALAAAAPFALEQRAVGTSANEYTKGGCRDIIFFFARGSTEAGNLGNSVGPPLAQGLKDAFGDARVAVEGVDYGAYLWTNLLPGGADFGGVKELEDLLDQSAVKCPKAILLVGGYSQGAALVHRAVEDRSAAVKARIAGAVTFGDTQKQQDGGRIKNFPIEKTLIICNPGDAVCFGTLTILPPHLDYVKRVPEAVTFLVAKAKAAGA